MTEREYCLAGDIRTLRHVQSLLMDVIPENNPAIPERQFRDARAALTDCLEALFAAMDGKLTESK